MTKAKYKVNSFFAGIGGFDLGFENQGFQTEYLCEINPFCNEVLSFHWPNVKKGTDICAIDESSIPVADVWCGGFPCQDVSVARGASQRLGLDGTRSGLFFRYAELIEKKRPKVVVIENVEGLFNSNGGRDFGVILQRMTQLGYAVAWRLVNSRYFGVPQSRSRVYLCCWQKDLARATHVMFDSVGAHSTSNARKDFVTEASKPNEYPKVPKVAYCLAATSGRHTGTDWSRTYIVCDDGVRRMTPLEYERLQGFPDYWTLPSKYDVDDDNTDTLRYTAIGNAVSVPVVEWIAKRISKQLSSKTDTMEQKDVLQYVPEFKKSKWYSYRATYSFSSEMSGAINQVLNYKDSLTKEFYSLQSKSSPQFEVFNPKCVVIIGRISAMDVDEVAAFERFRNSLNNVTVVTFDELYTRITGLITTLSNK